MMQAGVRLRQDTETTLPELPEQHRIREKEEELHGLESVHMAGSEIKCTTPGLNTLEPECVTAHSRVSDLHYTEASLMKTETDLGPFDTRDLKTESHDFTEVAREAHLHSDQIKTETVDGNSIEPAHMSVFPDTECFGIKIEEMKLESSQDSVSDVMNTELSGAGVSEKGHGESWQCAGEPKPDGKKSGKNLSELIHNVGIHVKETSHPCTRCEKTSPSESHVNNQQRIHTDEKPYKCDQCEKSFSWMSRLKSHQTIHTGEKPYKCDQCGKGLRSKCSVYYHERIHTDEKPFKCDLCEKSFTWKSNLKSHQRIHTGEKPYTCNQCGKCFNLKSNLQKHEQIHTGEKPYMCDQCEKGFFSKANLYSHAKIHTDEEPYTCGLCQKSFFSENVI
ncbi:hypothetical protein GJAV_G00087250 [Gymnothorax javanicus]|nr:hypothetical protein GJAV_G00087250 [Gymnothorax javanicus]